MTDANRQRRSKGGTGSAAGATRADLLAAAKACVRDRGLAGTTSRHITATAGTNLAAITYHFGSKDDLIAEALFDELRQRLEPALALLQVEGDAVTVMLGAIERLTVDFDMHRRDAPLYLEGLVAATRPGPHATAARTLLQSLRTRLRAQLLELERAGLLPGWVDPDAMAALILSVANGVALQVSIDRRGPDHRAIAGQFASLLAASAARP